MEKSFKDFVPLEEGVNDPAIFKAVFLAGGPGSGKSFVVGKSALTSFGLKLVNSDNAFEQALKKAATISAIIQFKIDTMIISPTRECGFTGNRSL